MYLKPEDDLFIMFYAGKTKDSTASSIFLKDNSFKDDQKAAGLAMYLPQILKAQQAQQVWQEAEIFNGFSLLELEAAGIAIN